MASEFATLQLVQNGETTIVSFLDCENLDQINIAACREQITEIVKQNQTKTLAFEMTKVGLIPSGMLGLLASLRDVVAKIQILNPSEDVREVLEITKLNQIFEVRDEVVP
jgi:anti-sigma B factor antagonist